MATTLLLKMLMLVSSTMASKYILVQEKMSWPHADNYCKETYGTSLATAWDFDADMNALSKLFQSVGSDTSGWIGLYITDDVTGEWQWTSGFHCDGDCIKKSPRSKYDMIFPLGRCGLFDMQIEGLFDVDCAAEYIFACDVNAMESRIAALEGRQSVLPVGFEVYEEYAVYALALINFMVLVCLSVYCMLRRDSQKVQYGGVVMSDDDKL